MGMRSLKVARQSTLHPVPKHFPRSLQAMCPRPHLDVPHELRQVEVPLLHEAGQLQNEAHGVVRLL